MTTDQRPTTVEALMTQADAIERSTRARRGEALEEYVRAGTAGLGGDDATTRSRVAAKAAAEEAARQVELATGGREILRSTRDLEVEAAAAARDRGDYAKALEHDEAAAIAAAKLRIAEHRLEHAEKAMWQQRAEVDRWTPVDDEVIRHVDREIERQRLEDEFDVQEVKAIDYRNAAGELAEAERLEAALPDLEARQVAGVERVRAAAAEHRRLATEAVDRWDGAEEIEMPPMDLSGGSGAADAPAGGAAVDPGVVLTGETGRAAFLGAARAQIGDPYRFGAETKPDDADPGAFDSSELVQWAAAQAGITLPDGSWKQYRHLAGSGSTVSVEDALRTPGALVFGFSSDPLASAERPARSYVGVSLGDGTVLDVSERAGEVRVMEPGSFYTHAAVIPELTADPPATTSTDVVEPDPVEPAPIEQLTDAPAPPPAEVDPAPTTQEPQQEPVPEQQPEPEAQAAEDPVAAATATWDEPAELSSDEVAPADEPAFEDRDEAVA